VTTVSPATAEVFGGGAAEAAGGVQVGRQYAGVMNVFDDDYHIRQECDSVEGALDKHCSRYWEPTALPSKQCDLSLASHCGHACFA